MAKLIDGFIEDAEIDQYIWLAQRIALRCAGDDRTVDTRPDPVVVATLMSSDKISGNIDGLWHQLESIWQLIINWVNSQQKY